MAEGWTGQWGSWPGGTAGTGWGLKCGGAGSCCEAPPPRGKRRCDVTRVPHRRRCAVQEALGSWEGTRSPLLLQVAVTVGVLWGVPAAPPDSLDEAGALPRARQPGSLTGAPAPYKPARPQRLPRMGHSPLITRTRGVWPGAPAGLAPRSAQGPCEEAAQTPPVSAGPPLVGRRGALPEDRVTSSGARGHSPPGQGLMWGPQPDGALLASPGRQPEHLPMRCWPGRHVLGLAQRPWGRGPKTTDLDVRGWVGGLQRG